MGVEIVLDEDDRLGLREVDIGQVVVREESGLPRFFEALPWIGASLHLQERDVCGLDFLQIDRGGWS
jgi:hypothetical protein